MGIPSRKGGGADGGGVDALSERAAQMREALVKNQSITDNMVSILGSFDHRLSALETAMRPTQVTIFSFVHYVWILRDNWKFVWDASKVLIFRWLGEDGLKFWYLDLFFLLILLSVFFYFWKVISQYQKKVVWEEWINESFIFNLKKLSEMDCEVDFFLSSLRS